MAVSELSNGTIFVSEVTGTAMLLLLGCGVVATAILKGSKGEGGGWLLINFGWGLAVFAGVYVAFRSGAHLNPAVTSRSWIAGEHHLRPVTGLLRSRTGRCLHRCDPRLAGVQGALRRRGGPGQEAGRLLHRTGDPQLRLEHRHRGHRHLRADLRYPVSRWHPIRPRPAVRGTAGGRHRCLTRWPDRVRDQPGS